VLSDLVLELVEGGDLLEYILKNEGLSEQQAQHVTYQMCDALAVSVVLRLSLAKAKDLNSTSTQKGLLIETSNRRYALRWALGEFCAKPASECLANPGQSSHSQSCRFWVGQSG